MSLSRRSFFQHATSLSLAAVVPHSIDTAQSGDALEELLRRRAEVIERRDDLDAKWLRIYQQVPERYKAGRPYVGVDGLEFGSLVGWPAADDDEATRLSSGVLIRRPSPSDLRKLFVQEAAESSREIAVERYRQRVSQLRRRCRAKRVYLRECSLPTSPDWERFDREIHAHDMAIQSFKSG
jgi:hypothetical protein